MRDLSTIVKAYDIRGLVPDELDEGIAAEVGAAFVRLTGAATVVVARDMRPSSPPLAEAFARGVTAQRADVIDVGLASTDLLYYASGHLNLPGAMFTASHNPAVYNGIKLCRAGAKPVGTDSGLAEIRQLAEHGVPPVSGDSVEPHAGRPPGHTAGHTAGQGTVIRRDLLGDYAEYLRTLVDLSHIRRLQVVVDAGNGMAGYTVPAVFEGLPVELVPLYFDLDGNFPNHEANPIHPENLRDLQQTVRERGADIGLAFDGDADRCFVVDERGDVVSPSVLTAQIALRELAAEPGATIIHNLITSRAVPELVAEHGGKPLRSRVGHSFIKATMAETGAVFGGEHSGHFYFRDFWFADSGMLAALHVLAALGAQQRPLSELLSDYSRYVASGEINSQVDDQAAATDRVRAAFDGRPGVALDELDGLTVEGDAGSGASGAPGVWWFNLRPSNTEPALRLNAEAGDEPTMAAVRDEVLSLVRG